MTGTSHFAHTRENTFGFGKANRCAPRPVASQVNESESMPHAQQSPAEPAAPLATWLASDDECVRKLAMLLEHRETRDLDEVVALMGRLAVTLE